MSLKRALPSAPTLTQPAAKKPRIDPLPPSAVVPFFRVDVPAGWCGKRTPVAFIFDRRSLPDDTLCLAIIKVCNTGSYGAKMKLIALLSLVQKTCAWDTLGVKLPARHKLPPPLLRDLGLDAMTTTNAYGRWIVSCFESVPPIVCYTINMGPCHSTAEFLGLVVPSDKPTD